MIRRILLGIVIFSSLSVYSQDQELTLTDAIMGRWTKFRVSGPSQLSWIPNTNYIAWVTADTADPKIVRRLIPGGEEETVINLNEIKTLEGMADLKRFPRFEWVSERKIKTSVKGTSYEIDFDKVTSTKLYSMPKGGANFDLNTKNDMAFTKGQNLFILSNGKEIQITSDTKDGVVNGQSVHRFEFGIHQGTFWSNNGNALAFYRKDESMVTNYPLANYTTKPASSTPVRYPMAGMPSHEVTIGIYNMKSQETVWLKTGEPKDQYLTNVAWGPEDKFIYVAILNRDQNHMKMNQYDASSGELIKTIFEEKHDKYVQPLHPMIFLPNDKSKFIWQSERSGFDHLYLYNLKGKVLNQITKGEWVVTSTHGFDEAGNIIVTRSSNRGMDRLVYKYNPENGNETPWITNSGVHSFKANSSGTMAIDRFSSIDMAYKLSIINGEGKEVETIKQVENSLEGYRVSKPELGMIKTNEGIELNTRMFKPADFDPNKKYKALIYVYNGPGVQLITNSWFGGAPYWMAYQANKGYIVFTVDGRGSENRGRDFEQAIFRQLGELEVVDQLSGVEYLRNLNYVDANKMAVHGWSYGGFMTTSLMLKAPGLFQVGVAGGPVIDWKYYEIMYTERYMDTPETNKAGFARSSLLDKVQNLRGDLLLIHGADDDVVVPQHSIDFLKHSVDRGVQVDFFLYPGHKHNVRGKDRVHLMQKVLDYIDEKME